MRRGRAIRAWSICRIAEALALRPARMSAAPARNTLRAYGDDVARFLDFLKDHLGGPVDRTRAGQTSPRRHPRLYHRRAAPKAGRARCAARAGGGAQFLPLSGARRHFGERRAARACARRACSARLPRPLSEHDAERALEEAGEHDVEWLAARDAALLTLLYGAGLRISEALCLKRGDVPSGRHAHHPGQGPQGARRAGAASGARSHRSLRSEDSFFRRAVAPLFLSRRGKPMSAREAQALMQRLRGRLGLPERATPHALRHSFATHVLAMAAICAACRNCWVTPRSRPRRPIPRSRRASCGRPTRRPPARENPIIFVG